MSFSHSHLAKMQRALGNCKLQETGENFVEWAQLIRGILAKMDILCMLEMHISIWAQASESMKERYPILPMASEFAHVLMMSNMVDELQVDYFGEAPDVVFKSLKDRFHPDPVQGDVSCPSIYCAPGYVEPETEEWVGFCPTCFPEGLPRYNPGMKSHLFYSLCMDTNISSYF